MDKKTKKRLEVLRQKVEKTQKLLAAAKQQTDDPNEVSQLETQIVELEVGNRTVEERLNVFGFINLNKPRNLGSRTAINSIVKLVKPLKVGHAGTLDPLASGVLVTAIGPATRLIRYVQDSEKQYRGMFQLGVTSNTEDIMGDVTQLMSAPVLSQSDIENVLPDFIGSIEQTPPQFSALKVDGVRAYKLARKGVEAKLKSRAVEIHSLHLSDFRYPNFELTICCSGGTYVRTLGRDIAKAVGSDAIMTDLQRTAVGEFRIKDSVSPDQLTAENLGSHLTLPQDAVAGMNTVQIDAQVSRQFVNAVAWHPDRDPIDKSLLAVDEQNRLKAVLQRQADGGYTPKLNFVHYWNDA